MEEPIQANNAVPYNLWGHTSNNTDWVFYQTSASEVHVSAFFPWHITEQRATNEPFFSYIIVRTSYFQWDDDMRFVLENYT
jgi:hypothetical protein